ncbi:MAG TPA: hypothetical protein VK689_03500 [Armatimonadota bacterium]|nr:hypothetical protein [Armatimonadota bacterium]
MKPAKFRCISILLVLAVLLTTGCSRRAALREPVSRFQSSASVVIASTRIYTTELNKVERDSYIYGQLGAREQIKLAELESRQVFSREGLRARLEALDHLSSYGDLLWKLANSDAPARVQAASNQLGSSLGALDERVRGLNGGDDTAFKSAFGPVFEVVSLILADVTERRIERALEKAVKDGEAPINRLVSVIRKDIVIAYERRRTALSGERVILVDEFNRELDRGAGADAEKLRLFASRIRNHEDRWEIFATANPQEGLDAMAAAHSALVKYARSPQRKIDLATLVDAMEAFASRANTVAQAVKTLRAS